MSDDCTTPEDGLRLLGGIIRGANPLRKNLTANAVVFYVRVLTEPISIDGELANMYLTDGYVPPPWVVDAEGEVVLDERYINDRGSITRPRLMFYGRVMKSSNGLRPHIFLRDPCRVADARSHDIAFINKLIAKHTLFLSKDSQYGITPKYGDIVGVKLNRSDFKGPDLAAASYDEILSAGDSSLYENNRSQNCDTLKGMMVAESRRAVLGGSAGGSTPTAVVSVAAPPQPSATRVNFSWEEYGEFVDALSPLLTLIRSKEAGRDGYNALNRGYGGDTGAANFARAFDLENFDPQWRLRTWPSGDSPTTCNDKPGAYQTAISSMLLVNVMSLQNTGERSDQVVTKANGTLCGTSWLRPGQESRYSGTDARRTPTRLSHAGAYQMNADYLRAACGYNRSSGGVYPDAIIDPPETTGGTKWACTLFNEATQNRLAAWGILTKRKTLGSFLMGLFTQAQEAERVGGSPATNASPAQHWALQELAMEWASFPCGHNRGGGSPALRGSGYHGGVANNPAVSSIHPSRVDDVLVQCRANILANATLKGYIIARAGSAATGKIVSTGL